MHCGIDMYAPPSTAPFTRIHRCMLFAAYCLWIDMPAHSTVGDSRDVCVCVMGCSGDQNFKIRSFTSQLAHNFNRIFTKLENADN